MAEEISERYILVTNRVGICHFMTKVKDAVEKSLGLLWRYNPAFTNASEDAASKRMLCRYVYVLSNDAKEYVYLHSTCHNLFIPSSVCCFAAFRD